MNLRHKNKCLKRKLASAEEMLCGAIDLLYKHGAGVGSRELLAAADLYRSRVRYTNKILHFVEKAETGEKQYGESVRVDDR